MASLYKRNGKGNWRINYFDHQGRRREKSARTTDKAAAQRIANDLEAKVALRRDGIIDAKAESFAEQGRKPLKEHVVDYIEQLPVRGARAKTRR